MLGQPRKSPVLPSRGTAVTWMENFEAGVKRREEIVKEGPTFEQLALEWWGLASTGRVEKRRGRRGERYSLTTLAGYGHDLRTVLIPAWGQIPAGDISATEWQRWVDELAGKGLSRSRIVNLLAVVRNVYAYATRPTRRLVAVNPTIGLDLPPKDERPRDRVALAPEAQQLISSLGLPLGVPYAIAMFGGLRRGEIGRLDWTDVLWDSEMLLVREAKSEAGTNRRAIMAETLSNLLLEEWTRQRRPAEGRVVKRSVESGKLAEAGRRAWSRHEPPLEPITLHESRHTYASMLLAAGYSIRELMDFMGHADLAATQRYLHRLPQPDEDNPADRLNRYLRGFEDDGT